MDPSTIAALGISGLVTAGTAVIKALWPGEMPTKAVYVTVALLTAVLLGLAVASGEIHGNAFELVTQWLLQAAGAIGLREATVTATGGAASELPSRS